METFLAVDAVVGGWVLMWWFVGWLFAGRRCVVCGRRVSRRELRAPKFWAENRWQPAHRGCVAVTAEKIERLLEGRQ